MPRVKFDCVVSFSSEDPKLEKFKVEVTRAMTRQKNTKIKNSPRAMSHFSIDMFILNGKENPASSLLSGEVSRRKWLGSKGDASHSVVLQLAKSTKIKTVTIGSHHAALVEVLVGRSERSTEPFKVLVLSSVFMTPSESKKGEAVSKVRTFQYEQLASDTRDQCWDRIRVVCLQPYNKHVKYGLSFIHIFEPESPFSRTRSPSPLPSAPPSLPSSQRFQIAANSSDEEDSFKPGELFAKIKSPKLSVDAQIRQASKPSALKNSTESPARLFRTQLNTTKTKSTDPEVSDDKERASRDKDSLLYKDEEKPNDKIDKIIQRDREEREKKDSERSHNRKEKEERGYKLKENDSGHSNDRKRKHESIENNRHIKKVSNSHTDSNKNDDTRKDTTAKNKDRDQKDRDSCKKDSHSRDRDRDPKRDFSRNYSDRKERDRNGESSSSRHSNKRRRSVDKDNTSKKLMPGPRSSSPHRLMSHVVLVMSGYQNPRRGALRDKALAMGAKYRPDWGDGCTHLVCAFDNTPKLRQVRSSDDRAVIVKGEWIEECCRERRLLPWQWFATEHEHRVKRPPPESDSEEEKPRVLATVSANVDSECDTDDEIQKVIDQQKKIKPESTERDNTSPKPQETETDLQKYSEELDVTFVRDERFIANVSISDSSETDSYTDEETPIKVENIEIDTKYSLPDFFEGYTFSVDSDLAHVGWDCTLLKRYITAYSGELVEHVTNDSVVNYVLSTDPACLLRRTVKSAALVKPEWIWKCHEKLRKVSSKDYMVK